MFGKRISVWTLGALALAAVSVPLTLTVSQAQVAPPPDQGVRPDQRGSVQPGAAGPGQFQRQPGMMMGGGAAALTSDNMFLYIVQGNRVFKLSKGDLKVVAETQLGGGMMPGAPEGRARPGGVGTPPPPPTGTAK